MKNLMLIITAVLFGTVMTKAATAENKVTAVNYTYGNSFIFMEDGITFSVYPDGEFDFYIDNRVNVGVGARAGNVGITFNSGFNYNPFVQYDDYGAVIQIENIPIFYDYFGRVSQIGNIDLFYRNGLVNRLGGLNIFYNGGVFSHYTGYVNLYNRRYIYRPFHRWFARPAVGFCNVWTTPYRRYYSPVRYTWHRPYDHNHRRAYAQVGREHRYGQIRRERDAIYRNDRRVAVRDNSYRSNRNTTSRSSAAANRSRIAENNKTRATSTVRSNRSAVTNRGAATVKRSTTAVRGNSSGRTVTKREVVRTPSRTTVKANSSTYNRPTNRSTAMRSAPNNGTRTVTRQTANRTTARAAQAPVRSKSSVSRGTTSRSTSTANSRTGSSTSRSIASRSGIKR